MKEKDKKFEAMESDYKAKIDMLDKLLKSEQEDDDYLTPLAGAIFNCTTMEDIFEIKNLVMWTSKVVIFVFISDWFH